jgi:hypothetical protein
MKFIVTNREDGRRFSVTPECVHRVIGEHKMQRLIKEANEDGVSFTYQFEGTYDIKAERGGDFK